MRIMTGVLICAAVFFVNPVAVFAQDDSPVPEPEPIEVPFEELPVVEEMLEPVIVEEPVVPEADFPEIPMDPGVPDFVEDPTAQVAPVLKRPVMKPFTRPVAVESVPSPESLKDEAIDSHIVIEDAPVSARPFSKETRNAFARIKNLAGRWEGSGAGNDSANENQEKVVVTYEVTAGGYAVLERIFPGTSQEIVTMYYEQDGYLTLMHFSLIGTRSLMELGPISGDNAQTGQNTFNFTLAQKAGIDPNVDSHMHSLQITFLDDDHIKQEWSMYEAGSQSGAYSFKLNRVLADNPAVVTPAVAGN